MKVETKTTILPCGHEIIEEADEDGSVSIHNGVVGICPKCSIKYQTDYLGWAINLVDYWKIQDAKYL